MIRSIVAFHPDKVEEWVAELSCFHNQHIRHRPPFQERAWVADPHGRAERLGSSIECPLCDRPEFPDGLSVVGRAGPWDQDCVAPALLRAHRIAEGRWGCLLVREGALEFQFESEDVSDGLPARLQAGEQQPIPPGAPHHIILTGPVRLELSFWGRPQIPSVDDRAHP